jgi:hypothetical protein
MDLGKIEIAVGVILAILGTIFSLQGVGIIGGSSLMDSNALFIYVGSFIAVIGLVLIASGLRSPNQAFAVKKADVKPA